MIDLIQSNLDRGGPILLSIACLSVAALALILWRLWRHARAGVWSRGEAEAAIARWQQGAAGEQAKASGLRARVARAAMDARRHLPDALAREETLRVAKIELASLRSGLRALDLIATIAPLLGLLGTVLGMIEVFQALESAQGRADPANLAGGIWEALLTTAAGMSVAIPVSMAVSWFEGIHDRAAADLEDIASRIFIWQMP